MRSPDRYTCKQCNKHPALYKDNNGRVKARKGFDLCRRCNQSSKDRERARGMVADYGVPNGG